MAVPGFSPPTLTESAWTVLVLSSERGERIVLFMLELFIVRALILVGLYLLPLAFYKGLAVSRAISCSFFVLCCVSS